MNPEEYIWPALTVTIGLAGASAILALADKRRRKIYFVILFAISWCATWAIFNLVHYADGKAIRAKHRVCNEAINLFTTDLETILRRGSTAESIERLSQFNAKYSEIGDNPIAFADKVIQLSGTGTLFPPASMITTSTPANRHGREDGEQSLAPVSGTRVTPAAYAPGAPGIPER